MFRQAHASNLGITRWVRPAAIATVVCGAQFLPGLAHAEVPDATAGASYVNLIEVCAELSVSFEKAETFQEDLELLGFLPVADPDSAAIAKAFVAAPSFTGLSVYNYEGVPAKALASELLQSEQSRTATLIDENLARQDNGGALQLLPTTYPLYQDSLGAIALAISGGFAGSSCSLALPLDDAVIEHFDLPLDESTSPTGYKSVSTRRLFRAGATIEFLWYAPSLSEPANIMPLQVHVRQDI